MKTAVLFDPSIGSLNAGDAIISESIQRVAAETFRDHYLCLMPTQMPVSRKIADRFRDADVKLVMGSNLLQSHMVFRVGRWGVFTHAIRQWDTNVLSNQIVYGSVLCGCGWQDYAEPPDLLTQRYWRKVLSTKYLHSVRDQYTADMLRRIGITNVVNTGCPTTWGLTPSHCEQIPAQKAEAAVATITDYRADRQRDSVMLRTLLENYRKVYLWFQGRGDEAYFSTFDEDIQNGVCIVRPNLRAYTEVLEAEDSLDYVGTRLHGGIYALQHKVRSVIIGIDNRALEMKNTGLCVLPAAEIEDLPKVIHRDLRVDIHLEEENIHRFLSQFK